MRPVLRPHRVAEPLEPLDALAEVFGDVTRLVAIADDVGRDQHDQLDAVGVVRLGAEEPAEHGDIHEEGNAAAGVGERVVDDAPDQHAVAVLHDHRRLCFARAEGE